MSNNNNANDYNQREGRVLELYDQGKNTREIAKELRMSLRDIGFILKKGQMNHGITAIMDNMNNQIAILHRTMYQLSVTCSDRRNEISYLQAQIQILEEYVNELKNNRNQQQEEIQNKS
jgi:orotate phosphoribosyltransferase-like protein